MPINIGVSALGLQKDNGDLLPRIIQYVETITASHLTKTAGQYISEFDCNITPKHASSHILLFAHVCVGVIGGAGRSP